MRLLHVIQSADPRHGGPIEALTARAGLLGRLGHRVEVASCDDPGADFVRDATLPIHALGPGLGKYGWTPRLLAWLRAHHRGYDAVIVNGVWQYNGLAVRQALADSGRRYFLFPHGMLDPWFGERYPIKHLKKLPYWLLVERFNLLRAAAVLFTSEEERQRARRAFPCYAAAREEIAPYGVAAPEKPLDDYRRAFAAVLPALANTRYLIFMGRLHEKKGVDLLLDAFASVAAGHPDVSLLIAGPDDTPYADLLKKRAQRLGMAARVTWAGMLSGDVKYGALVAAEAFVLPSHQENFGVAVVEALACGTPVLISDKVNIWREVEAGGAAYVEADTVEGTRRLLDRWLALPAPDRAAMAAAAQPLFRERFDIASSLDRFLDIVGGNVGGDVGGNVGPSRVEAV